MSNEDMLNQQPTESKGSLIGSVIVVLILIVGAVYLFASRGPVTSQPGTDGVGTTTGQVAITEQADDVDSLEAEAQSIDLNSLDTDAAALEQTVVTP